MLRAVFFGTPEFAVPSLSRLLEGGIEVPLVITQPDRPAGRHARPLPSAVARLAAVRGLRVSKPERLRGQAQTLDRLARINPDVAVVVAYGKILPKELLDLPRLGGVNLHASLLPKFRGASPIQAALLAGDSETGVVTMRMVEELDAGPLYLERRVAIGEHEDAGCLSQRTALAGAELLVETLRELEAGTLTPTPQKGTPSSCRPIFREHGEVDWTLPAFQIERRLRAYTPWPGLYSFLREERIKIPALRLGSSVSAAAGEIWREEDGRLYVAAGDRMSLELVRVQRSGRKPVSGAEFARGFPSLPARFDSRATAVPE